jgi:hypothetical protein
MIQQFASRSTKLTATIVTTALITAPALFAQGAAAPSKKTLLDKWVIDGGWTMFFIGAAIVAFIALAIYNSMLLTKAKFCPADLKAALMDHIAAFAPRSSLPHPIRPIWDEWWPTRFPTLTPHGLKILGVTRLKTPWLISRSTRTAR